jgi:hypothetical protein
MWNCPSDFITHICLIIRYYIIYIKHNELLSKAVLLHTMVAPGGKEGTMSTHSSPWHQVGLSGQDHAPAILCPWGWDPWYPSDRGLGGPQSWPGCRG